MWIPVAAVPPSFALLVVAAVDTVPAFDPWSLLTQAPLLGICILFMLDKIHGPGMKKDRDEARQQLADLNAKVISDVVPAIIRASDALSRRGSGDG